LISQTNAKTHSPPLDPQSSSRLESSTDPPSREGCICLPLLVPPCLDTRSCRRPRRARDLTAGLLRVSVRGVSACSRHPAHDNRLGRGNHRGVTRADTGVCPYIRAPIIPTAAVLSRGFLHFLHYLHCFLIVQEGSLSVKTGIRSSRVKAACAREAESGDRSCVFSSSRASFVRRSLLCVLVFASLFCEAISIFDVPRLSSGFSHKYSTNVLFWEGEKIY